MAHSRGLCNASAWPEPLLKLGWAKQKRLWSRSTLKLQRNVSISNNTLPSREALKCRWLSLRSWTALCFLRLLLALQSGSVCRSVMQGVKGNPVVSEVNLRPADLSLRVSSRGCALPPHLFMRQWEMFGEGG